MHACIYVHMYAYIYTPTRMYIEGAIHTFVAVVAVVAAVLVDAAGLEGPGRAVRGEKQIKQTHDEPQWMLLLLLLLLLVLVAVGCC